MSSLPERVATLEADTKNIREDVIDTKKMVTELHTHFLKGEGAKEARKENAVHRYYTMAGISAAVSAAVGLLTRLWPHADALAPR